MTNKKINIVYKLEIYLARELIPMMIDEVTKLGAGKINNYDHIGSYYEIVGCWRAIDDSISVIGANDVINYGKEYKLEIRCEEQFVREVLRKIREVHPYNEALINVTKLENHNFE